MKRTQLFGLVAALSTTHCGGSVHVVPEYPPFEAITEEELPLDDVSRAQEPVREPPPPSGPTRDVRFPPLSRATTRSGLAVDVIPANALPVVHLSLVFRSGLDSDPADLPGLASFVADMLKEGTRRKSSAALAGAFDAIGARTSVSAGAESVSLNVAVTTDALPAALALVAEMVAEPAFDPAELEKLKRRERDRLALSLQDPAFLARRAIRTELYGDHPYAHFDTTLDAIDRLTRDDLVAWHRTHIVPANAMLVVAGDVTSRTFLPLAERAFARFRGGPAPTTTFPTPPARERRTVVVIDRPGSVQSVIRVANLALPRGSADFVPLTVANQVLGGSANARLFVDLREQRSLTYGAYSGIVELSDIAPFAVATSVRTAVTLEAVDAIFEHLTRISTEAVSEEELEFAERYLADSFPLQIDTPGKIASLVVQQRLFGLPDGYWDGYRTSLDAVTAEEALAAARRYIQPENALVVVVGESSAFAEPLARLGAVRVIDATGRLLREFPARAP